MPHTVHIVGEQWSGRAYELREVFQSCAIPHTFSLADSEEGRELLSKVDPPAKLPLMLLPDGRALKDPSNAEIAAAAGAPVDLEEHAFDVLIVGAGPAGLSAAVYGASEGLAHPGHRRRRHRWAGQIKLVDSQLSRLPQGRKWQLAR